MSYLLDYNLVCVFLVPSMEKDLRTMLENAEFATNTPVVKPPKTVNTTRPGLDAGLVRKGGGFVSFQQSYLTKCVSLPPTT